MTACVWNANSGVLFHATEMFFFWHFQPVFSPDVSRHWQWELFGGVEYIWDRQMWPQFWHNNSSSCRVFESSQLVFPFALFIIRCKTMCCSLVVLITHPCSPDFSVNSQGLPRLNVHAGGFYVPFAHILFTKFRSPDRSLPLYKFAVEEIFKETVIIHRANGAYVDEQENTWSEVLL